MTLLLSIIAPTILISVAFSVWMVRMLDAGGREMHKHLERNGDKYTRHIGALGESTFTKVKE